MYGQPSNEKTPVAVNDPTPLIPSKPRSSDLKLKSRTRGSRQAARFIKRRGNEKLGRPDATAITGRGDIRRNA